jgi:hypothetical protein
MVRPASKATVVRFRNIAGHNPAVQAVGHGVKDHAATGER